MRSGAVSSTRSRKSPAALRVSPRQPRQLIDCTPDGEDWSRTCCG
jgi:hypothetical protein